MCGFVGVFRGTAEEYREEGGELARLLASSAHRGPDGQGVYAERGVGVAVARLAIRGDVRARQPVTSRDGRVVLAFNGEILGDAAEALRREVAAGGVAVPPPAAGDGPLLVEALAHLARRDGRIEGSLLLGLLEGSMGALACHDRETDELHLARDRLGVKPLHVAVRGDDVHFASEIRPLLLRFPELRRVDETGMAELLHWQRPVAHLPFAGVRALPPGTAWCVGRGGRIARRDTGKGIRSLEERDALAPREAVAELGTAWRRAARAAADHNGPVALLLSGGLDSGAVALGCGRSDVLALTGRFAPPGGPLDESEAAAAVAAAAGVRHEVVDLADGDLVGDLPAVVRALEVPLAGPGALALWRVARRAREHGAVVLSGTGGDELLGGYARTALVLGRRGPWTVDYAPLARRLETAGGDLASRQRAVLDRSDDLRGLLAEDLAGRLARPEVPSAVARGEVGDERAVEALVAEEIEGTLPMLLHVEDRVTMAFGLEGRPVPCLGAVPRAAARIPPAWLVGPDGEGKRALRAALAGVMPEGVRIDPTKRGFPTPFARAARGAGRDAVRAVIEDRRFAERGWWDVGACRARLDEERPLHDRGLYALLSWEFWARAFLDGDALQPEGPA